MADRKHARRNRPTFYGIPCGTLVALAFLCFAAAPAAHAQAATEYSGATGTSASVVTSQPKIVGHGHSGPSRTLANPAGQPPEKINRDWFAKEAGKKGARLSIDAVPARSRVWIDGKYVGEAPVTVTLPAGKHHLSLAAPPQEHANRNVDIATGKNQHLEIHLEQTYPRAVSITVFGNNPH